MLRTLALLVRLLLTCTLILLFVPAAILGLIANTLAGTLIATAVSLREALDALWAVER